MERIINNLNMLGDDGVTYPVVEIEELITSSTLKGTDTTPGMRRLELADGGEIIALDGNLVIRSSRVKLTQID